MKKLISTVALVALLFSVNSNAQDQKPKDKEVAKKECSASEKKSCEKGKKMSCCAAKKTETKS